MTVFALVDANNFYATCETVFAPKLAGRPLVVLSNNDGCIVARSAEARALGIRMGAPLHEWRDFCRQHGVVIRSSNYALYGDMSRRMVSVLQEFAERVESYSIDECFLDLSGVPDATRHGVALRAALARRIKLQCGVGIGPTRTLAKFANHIAKQQACWGGVFNLADHEPALVERLLAGCPAGQVWGIGYRLIDQLAALGIVTALDLRRADPMDIRRRFSVVQERVVRELNGESCLAPEVVGARQQLMSTRSFGQLASDPDVLRAAVSHHASVVAARLRAQQGRAQYVQVMIRTNPNRPQDPQHRDSVVVALQQPTADTGLLVMAAVEGLRRLYRPGHGYQKVGVMLGGLCGSTDVQPDLFRVSEDPRRQRLMATLDDINRLHGRDTLRVASAGLSKAWLMRAEHRSPRYTTCLGELPVVRAGEHRARDGLLHADWLE